MEEEIYKDKPAMMYGDYEDTETANGTGPCQLTSKTHRCKEGISMCLIILDHC